MSKAVESIVRGYVLLENRRALEDLLTHRQKLLDELNRVSGIDPNQVVSVIRDEIAIIQDGLERLDARAAGGQGDDRVKVLRLTVSEAQSIIDNSASTPAPVADAPSVADQLVQPQPPAGKVEAELPQAASVPGQGNTEIRALGLAVSVASTPPAAPASSASPGSTERFDPGSFALCAPSSNEPTEQLEDGEQTDTPSSRFDVLKTLMSVWSDKPGKA